MDEQQKNIYDKAVIYLEDRNLDYCKNALEYTAKYYICIKNNILTRQDIYNELNKYFNKKIVSAVLNLLDCLINVKECFPLWKNHLNALKHALNI